MLEKYNDMEAIDINWLKKIQDKVDSLSRFCSKIPKERRCEKQIFIARYFKFLKNRTFKININGETYFALFSKSITTTVGEDYHKTNSYGVKYCLTYGTHDYIINFIDEKMNRKEFGKIHWNDIIEIKFKEIDIKEYFEVVKKFRFEEKLVLIN